MQLTSYFCLCNVLMLIFFGQMKHVVQDLIKILLVFAVMRLKA
jgi:hypothetical protein